LSRLFKEMIFSFCVDVVVVVAVDNKVCLEGAKTVWYGGFIVLFVLKAFIMNGPIEGCECGHSVLSMLLLYVSVDMLMLSMMVVLSLVLMVLFALLLFITWRTGVGLMFVVVSLGRDSTEVVDDSALFFFPAEKQLRWTNCIISGRSRRKCACSNLILRPASDFPLLGTFLKPYKLSWRTKEVKFRVLNISAWLCSTDFLNISMSVITMERPSLDQWIACWCLQQLSKYRSFEMNGLKGLFRHEN